MNRNRSRKGLKKLFERSREWWEKLLEKIEELRSFMCIGCGEVGIIKSNQGNRGEQLCLPPRTLYGFNGPARSYYPIVSTSLVRPTCHVQTR